MKCPSCKGSGRDEKKTITARKKGICDEHSYIWCWTCNGNGVEPPYPNSSEK